VGAGAAPATVPVAVGSHGPPQWEDKDARGDGLKVGLDDLRGLFHPSWFSDSTAGAEACPAPDVDFYRVSLKPVAGCNPPPAISIYYDYFAYITS